MRLDPTRIVIRPLLTEKGTALQQARNTYLFDVAPAANKLQIRQAVEEIYKDRKVTVEKVTTLRVKGKFRRDRTKGLLAPQGGYTRDRKKAFVTLKKGDTLDTV